MSRHNGYLLEIPPEAVDLHQFTSLADRARTTSSLNRRAFMLQEALGLWRGPVLADVLDDQDRSRIFGDVEESHVAMQEEWLECQVELGYHRSAVAPLTGFVVQHPLRERPVALLMLALYRCGRKPEALAVRTDFVARLRNELGLDGSRELDQLHVAILRDAPELTRRARPAGREDTLGSTEAVAEVVAEVVTPSAQLPLRTPRHRRPAFRPCACRSPRASQ
jgi:DNA-binding SARP family transcriptional activator